MPRTLTSAIEIARHVIAQDKAWLWLVEIEKAGGGAYRLAGASRHVEADGVVWQACGLRVDLGEEAAQGDLSRFSVSVPNIAGVIARAVEVEGEVVGQTVRVFMAHESDLDHPVEITSGTVHSLVLSHTTATAECGESGQSVRVPARVIDRRRFPQVVANRGGSV